MTIKKYRYQIILFLVYNFVFFVNKIGAYDRNAAIKYAEKYYQNYNTAHYSTAFAGADTVDCANFASQILIAGNWVLPGGDDELRYGDNNTFMRAEDLRQWLINTQNITESTTPPTDLKKGDVIFAVGFDFAILAMSAYHTSIVSSTGSPFNYTAHTEDRFDNTGDSMIAFANTLLFGRLGYFHLPDAPIIKWVKVMMSEEPDSFIAKSYDGKTTKKNKKLFIFRPKDDGQLGSTSNPQKPTETDEYYENTYDGLVKGITGSGKDGISLGKLEMQILFDYTMDKASIKVRIHSKNDVIAHNFKKDNSETKFNKDDFWIGTIDPEDSMDPENKSNCQNYTIEIDATSANPSQIDQDNSLDEYNGGLNKQFNCRVDPTFIQSSNSEPISISANEVGINTGTAIVSHISVPVNGNIVKANVPICGIAGGYNFSHYKLEYAEIDSCFRRNDGQGSDSGLEWIMIKESYDSQVEDVIPELFVSGDKDIYGNLGNWHTGLVNYEYPFDEWCIDLGMNGDYILKLTVFGKNGETAVDTRLVTVGYVLSNSFGGKAVSPDANVRIEIQEQSMQIDFTAAAIKRCDDISIVSSEYQQVSKVYKVVPGDIVLRKPGEIIFEISVPEVDLTKCRIAKLNELGEIVGFGSTFDVQGSTLSSEIAEIGTDDYYAVVCDTVPPDVPVVSTLPSITDEIIHLLNISGGQRGYNYEVNINGEIKYSGIMTGVSEDISITLLPDEVSYIKVRFTDSSGNIGGYSEIQEVEVKLNEAPQINTMFFDKASAGIGEKVLITVESEDIDTGKIDKITGRIYSSMTDNEGVHIQLIETSNNTGIYKAEFEISDRTTEGAIAAATEGEEIKFEVLNSQVTPISLEYSDNTKPTIPEIVSSSFSFLINNSFEKEIGAFRNENQGVRLTRVLHNNSYSLKLENLQDGGNFITVITDESFSVDSYPIMRFNYSINNVNINILIKVNGKWYDIVFTDEEKEGYQFTGIEKIGAVTNVFNDGRIGTAHINLKGLLLSKGLSTTVEKIIFADWDIQGYKRLVGGSPSGAYFYIDNFYIGGISGSEFSITIDSQDSSGIDVYTYAISSAVSENNEWMEISDNTIVVVKESDGPYYVNVVSSDNAGNESDENIFLVYVDSAKPHARKLKPLNNIASRFDPIVIHISDNVLGNGDGIDIDSIKIEINGKSIVTTGT